jgi:3-isopropylmalate dehydratase small subunit
MSRRQVAFQLAVRSLRTINVTHRDLPHSACPSSRVHAGVVLVQAGLRCAIASTRTRRRGRS